MTPFLLLSCWHDLQVGDDAVAIPPKANGASGAVAEFIDHQRWFGCAIDEDFHLALFDDDLGVKPGISIGRGFDGFLELARLFLPQLLPRPLRLADILHSVRFIFGISRPKIEWSEIDRIVSLCIHHTESHADEAALWRPALALCIKLDGTGAELESIEPDDILFIRRVELDGRRAILLNEFRGANATLPSLSIGHGP